MSEIDHLIPDPLVAKELGVSTVTLYRYDCDPRKIELGWPAAIRTGDPIRGRKYRSRAQFEEFKRNVLAQALRERKRRVGAPAAAVTAEVA